MEIRDCIYGPIKVPELCKLFIDTSQFQRLRRVKQLGLCHYVYPSSVHTRFEHSIGVMHLVGKAIDSICVNSGQKIDLREKEIIMPEV